jgi:hypothetical protein
MNGLHDFDLLTVADVAELLHCSKAHVCNAIAGRVQGCVAIPAVSLGRRKLVRDAHALYGWPVSRPALLLSSHSPSWLWLETKMPVLGPPSREGNRCFFFSWLRCSLLDHRVSDRDPSHATGGRGRSDGRAAAAPGAKN